MLDSFRLMAYRSFHLCRRLCHRCVIFFNPCRSPSQYPSFDAPTLSLIPDSSTLSMLHLTLVMAIWSLVSCWCFSSCWWGTSSSSLLANTMDSDACGINFQSVLPVIPIQSASRTRYSIRSGLWRIDPFTCIVDSVGFVNRFFTWCLWRFNPWSCLDDGLVLMIPTLLMLHYDAFLLLPANTAIFSSTNATFLSCRLDPYPLLLLLLRSFGSNSLHCRCCCCFLY